MKEKRYFCDRIEKFFSSLAKSFLTLFLSLIIILPIYSIIDYNVHMSNFENLLNSYSAETYKHLDTIANSVIKKGVGIDLIAIPDDVVTYNFSKEADKILFEFYLKDTEEEAYSFKKNMTIELSHDFDIISKTSDYPSSEEEYIKRIKSSIFETSISDGIYCWLILFLVCFCGISIATLVSIANKNKDEKRSRKSVS